MQLGVIGEPVDVAYIESYVIGGQVVPKSFVTVLDEEQGIIQSSIFCYPISLTDFRVKLIGKQDSSKVGYERIEDDIIQLTVYVKEDRAERYALPGGKSFITGEGGELQLPVIDISYGYVSIDKQGKDVVGIKPYRVELNTSLGINVVSEILRTMDKEKIIVFELASDLEGWMKILRADAQRDRN